MAEWLRVQILLLYLTAVSGVGSRPMDAPETSQVLLVGEPGEFSRGSPPVLVPHTDCLSHILKETKLNKK